MDLPNFVLKWTASQATERAAAQEHFIDLCGVLGHLTPGSDAKGETLAFEKGVSTASGGEGWADVWKKGHFAWEYKGKHANLNTAFQQLLRYKDDLGNPPLLIVCDLDRFEIHTNFTNTTKRVYAFSLTDLLSATATPTSALPPIDVLRAAFYEPYRLRPTQTTQEVTEAAAAEFAALAESLRSRGVEAEQAAHFLMRLLFCLFADDVGLLPSGLLTRLIENTKAHPSEFSKRISLLFQAMATGGFFGADDIKHFNGGLFTDANALDLTQSDLTILARAASLDWSNVEPAIFGTLFERSLDPEKRGQIGAFYTSREDIERIVEPVLMAPLRRKWLTVQEEAKALATRRDAAIGATRTRLNASIEKLITGFAAEIGSVRVLDPACGSGNFLYVALKALLDLEKQVYLFAIEHKLSAFILHAGPEQVRGIEINSYAHELAQVVVWIGYIQWLRDNGFGTPSSPVLKPLHTIEHMDAILAFDENGLPVEPHWPEADVIVGNPPFLGGKFLRRELGDDYVDSLFRLYDGRVPREADLVTYWFERTRALTEGGALQRAGLLSTQGIRGGANRRVLQRIKDTGDIFMAWSDRPWVLEGASVRVSMIGFDKGQETTRVLDGAVVMSINSNLTTDLDLTQARRLQENMGFAFMGDTKGGRFDIPAELAKVMLAAPLNPNGRPNSDVLRPWINGLDVTRRPRGLWIIDFGVDCDLAQAALYELPFEHVRQQVEPFRKTTKRQAYRERWWIHMEPRPALRAAIRPLSRYIGTPRVAKHRIFVWINHPTLPDSQIIVIARDDDYCLGVLHSRVHQVWALQMGTALEDRPRYTPTTTFETFPFPWPLGQETPTNPLVQAIACAARDFVQKRDGWLNAPGLTDSDQQARTLTNLYNNRPSWLAQAHGQLDSAVMAAYGWPEALKDNEILERLLLLNDSRAGVVKI